MEYIVSCLAWSTLIPAADEKTAETIFRLWYKIPAEEEVSVVDATTTQQLPNGVLAPAYARAQYL